jgi:hypothetical protein
LKSEAISDQVSAFSKQQLKNLLKLTADKLIAVRSIRNQELPDGNWFIYSLV